MEAQVIQLASDRQRQFLDRLCKRTGASIEKALETLTAQEASELIDQLLAAENGQGAVNGGGQARPPRQDGWAKRSDEVKLGLATKLVYARWGDGVLGITKSKSLRQAFIEEVIKTHQIFRDIDGRVAGIQSGGESHA